MTPLWNPGVRPVTWTLLLPVALRFPFPWAMAQEAKCESRFLSRLASLKLKVSVYPRTKSKGTLTRLSLHR